MAFNDQNALTEAMRLAATNNQTFSSKTWAYIQQFPARFHGSTNKFGVFFYDTHANKNGDDSGLTFLLIDMDELQVRDIEKASKEIEKIISEEFTLNLGSSNRRESIAVQWPCICGQEWSPFPFFQEQEGSMYPIPNPGYWHDPNQCLPPVTAPEPQGLGAATAAFTYTPADQTTSLPNAGGVMAPWPTAIASSVPYGPTAPPADPSYTIRDFSVASPTNRAHYAPGPQGPASSGSTYNAIAPESSVIAMASTSQQRTVGSAAPYTASACAITGPQSIGGVSTLPYFTNPISQTRYNVDTTTEMVGSTNAAAPFHRRPPGGFVSISSWADRDYKYPLITNWGGSGQGQGGRGGGQSSGQGEGGL
ncbi:hypothetical protein F5Y19DRAFT_487269 [Xylariaceae sp. FL1651]|nr:hypothetical protein F5Y19DRAFT_487269 [Xylariaceae sp. FL1651]